MPGNTIKINDSNDLEWHIGDSKMPKFIEYLDKIGIKTDNPGYIGISPEGKFCLFKDNIVEELR